MRAGAMALQIADRVVVAKVERLAKATGLTAAAVVERAIDRLAAETLASPDPQRSLVALLVQLDQLPDRSDAADPLRWGASGLPE
jgi:hypothetical protein